MRNRPKSVNKKKKKNIKDDAKFAPLCKCFSTSENGGKAEKNWLGKYTRVILRYNIINISLNVSFIFVEYGQKEPPAL